MPEQKRGDGMLHRETGKNGRRNRWLRSGIAGAALLLCTGLLIGGIYAGQYYPADKTAQTALGSGENVTVVQMDYGWLFDGPSETDALIFYPGGKVEETAYAPLLRRLAEQGMDACLVKMPLRLAVFGVNKADQVMKCHDYARWVVGGHSLGGAMAASYAAKHASRLEGVAMLAAYPTEALDDQMRVVLIYGSEDGVLNRSKLEAAKRLVPDGGRIIELEGANHAGFGNYGNQKGDGRAAIPSEEQQRRTVEHLVQAFVRNPCPPE